MPDAVQGVAGFTGPVVRCTAGVPDLSDDWGEIALRTGGIGQPLLDKWRKRYKILLPKQIVTLAKAV
jgi:hypothetical protein